MAETASTPAPSIEPGNSGKNRKAIVVGCGPAGALMALYLARENWNVCVCDRRDASVLQVGHAIGVNRSGRSYNIVLNRRSIGALKRSGVELPAEKMVAIAGGVRHTNKGIQFSQRSNAVSVNRNVLAMHLCEEGQGRFPDRIEYYFGRRLHSVDFDRKIATFASETGDIEELFDLLVGADGVFSSVRQTMAEHFQGFAYQQNKDEMTFKVCHLGKATELPGAEENWGLCSHVWPSVQPVTIIASPNPDGSLTGILIMPQEGETTFEKIKTEADVEALFASKFPDIFNNKPLPQDFSRNLLDQKISYGGITTTCSTFHGSDRVVLVGDAAHSVWPSLGQGCNVALESCLVLTDILVQFDGNLSTALPAYTAARKPDTDAIGRMSEDGFGGNKRARNPLFFAKIMALLFLHKLLPGIFGKPAAFNVGNPEIRYSEIEALLQTQEKQLLFLAICIIALPVVAIGIWLHKTHLL